MNRYGVLFFVLWAAAMVTIAPGAWRTLNKWADYEVASKVKHADGICCPCASPGYYVKPQGQRTWDDLFAACRLIDGWLGSTSSGEPVCYPIPDQR